jgi:hypothetical protein
MSSSGSNPPSDPSRQPGKPPQGPKKPDAPSKKSWRGSSESPEDAARYRWQAAGAAEKESGAGRKFWFRVKVATLFLLAFGLIGCFIYYLILRAPKTPFIAVAITAYPSPVSTNAWAREDVDGFESLEGETLEFADLSTEWLSDKRAVESLKRQLKIARPSAERAKILVLYLSLHGVSDEAGNPCLQLANSAPLASKTWFPLSTVLEELKQLPDSVRKLVVLDCSRMPANWSAGILHNSFSDRLEGAVKEAEVPGLAVLNSTGPGEYGWSSPELQRSVFGNFMLKGLEGAADREDEGGDGDKQISLRELTQYLEHHVGQWARENRADVQVPMLVPADAPDCTVAYVRAAGFLGGSGRSAGKSPAPDEHADKASTGTATPLDQEITELWRRLDELPARQLYRFDPVGWQHFVHKLLRLEQLAIAGCAYELEAKEAANDLRNRVAKLGQPRLAGSASVAHSLPLADQFGKFTDGEDKRRKLRSEFAAAGPGFKPLEPFNYLARAEAAWSRVLDEPTREIVARAVEFAGDPDRSIEPGVVEAHFLRMLHLHLDPDAGKDQQRDLIKLAVASRSQAERVASLLARSRNDKGDGPIDERTQYWAQALVDQADRDRRLAEDGLFIGDAKIVEESRDRWTKANLDYDEARKTIDQVEDALNWRDRAWAEVPFMARWLTRDQPQGQSAGEWDDSVNAGLLPLVHDTQELAAILDEPLDMDGADPARLRGRLDAMKRKLDDMKDGLKRLEGSFQSESERLRKANDDQTTLRGIEAALQVPMLPWRDREEFRSRARAIAQEMFRKFPGTPRGRTGQAAKARASGSDGESTEPLDVGATRLERVTVIWDEHPALAILAREVLETGVSAKKGEKRSVAEESAAPLKLAAADDWADEVRGELASLPSTSTEWFQKAAQDLAKLSDGRQSLLQSRLHLSRADRLVRSGAVLLAAAPDGGVGSEPAARLRLLDLHNLLTWHSQRTLDDFLGPPDPLADSQTAFFAKAAKNYLDAAEDLAKAAVATGDQPTPPQRPKADDALVNLFKTRTHAAAKWVALEGNVISPGEEDDEPEVPHYLLAGPVAGLPAGNLALFLRASSGSLIPLRATDRIGNLRRLSMPTEPAAAGSANSRRDYLVNRHNLETAGSKLEAVALFRGHQVTLPIPINQAKGIKLVHTATDRLPSHITVTGQSTVRGAVVVILDCSASMQEGTAGAGEGAVVRRRFDVARESFDTLLTRLEQGKRYRVGVRFYGHRVGFMKDKGFTTQKNPDWIGPDGKPAPDIRPGEDEQQIRSIGQFGAADHEDLRRQLKMLRPMGVTPVYLSLFNSLKDDFRDEERDVPKSIVVITDGMNYQAPEDPNFKREFEKSAGDVVREAANNENVRIFIVGFELSKEEERKARQDFEAIAERTRGKYFSANNPLQLAEVLEQLIPNQFAALPADGSAAAPKEKDWVDIDRRAAIELARSTAAREFKYTIQVKNTDPPVKTDVTLEGGESLQLFVSDDGRKLEHRLYRDRIVQFVPALNKDGLLDPLDAKRQFRIGLHRPERQGAALVFPISIQNAAEKEFTPRPAEAWVDVVPVFADGPNPNLTYSFYDMTFESDRPVPVLSCAAPDWPPDAKEADVKVWFKTRATEPNRRARLGTIANKPGTGAAAGALTIDGLPGLTFGVQTHRNKNRGDPYRIVVTERHPPGDTNFYSAKVELNPPATKTTRRFDPDTGTVVHTFYVPDAPESEIINNYELWFLSRRSLERDAVQFNEPARLKIRGPGEVLRN